jgi:hypothetical protein
MFFVKNWLRKPFQSLNKELSSKQIASILPRDRICNILSDSGQMFNNAYRYMAQKNSCTPRFRQNDPGVNRGSFTSVVVDLQLPLIRSLPEAQSLLSIISNVGNAASFLYLLPIRAHFLFFPLHAVIPTDSIFLVLHEVFHFPPHLSALSPFFSHSALLPLYDPYTPHIIAGVLIVKVYRIATRIEIH